MSKELPKPGTTVILRKRSVGRQYPALLPPQDAFVIVREINHHDVRVELKGQPFEAYIPKRFWTSAGSTLETTPPIIALPSTFVIETLPL